MATRLSSLCTVGSQDPVGPGFRRGDILFGCHTGERRYPLPQSPRPAPECVRGERAKQATPRIARDRQASEAKPQIKPHASPAPPGDPWLPLGGTGAPAP